MRSFVLLCRLLLACLLVLCSLDEAAAQPTDWDLAEGGALDRQAEAADVELEPVLRDPYRGHLSLETAFFRRSESGTTTTLVSPMVDFAHRAGDSLELGARFGLGGAVLDAPAGNASRLRAGNPEISAGYYHAFVSWPNVVELRVLARVSLPTASLDDSSIAGLTASNAGLRGAIGMRGARDAWLWLPDTLGVVLPSVRVDFQRHALELSGSFDFALLVPTADTATRDLGSLLQLRIEAAYRVVEPLRLGAALSSVAVFGGDGIGADDVQSSVDLFAGVDTGGAMAELRLTTNLDAPFGSSFDHGIWALRLALGVHLP